MGTVRPAANTKEEQLRAYLARRAADVSTPANARIARRRTGPPEPRITMRPPKLREASLRDYEQITRLQSRYGLASKTFEEWSHLWLGNPLYRELQPGWPIGWVLEDENNQIVGSMGNIPLPSEFEGRRILVASGSNWVAEPAYRSASLLLLDHVINQRGVDLYVNNTVGAAAVAAVSALDCAPVPVGQWDRSAYWIAHHQSYFEAPLIRRKWPFARPVSYALAAPVFLRDRLRAKALGDNDVEVRPSTNFDEHFDDFWAALRAKNPHVLLGVRTREVLHWHYKHAVLGGTAWIATVVDGPRLAAYATFQRRDKPAWRETRVQLVDFQSLDGTTALLPPLLSWALKRCRAERIQTLEIVGRWLGTGELIETIAPYRHELASWRYVYRAMNPRLEPSLRNPGAWAPSLFDGDASL